MVQPHSLSPHVASASLMHTGVCMFVGVTGVTPFGVPNCATLQGDPLQNVAIGATPSAHSQWAWQENAGMDAVVDGVIDVKCTAPIAPAPPLYPPLPLGTLALPRLSPSSL